MTFILPPLPRVKQIRQRFALLLEQPPDLGDDSMLEIAGCQFFADEPAIFGTPNEDWHRRELDWYLSQSRNVKDIPPPVPSIWETVAAKDGTINSNYGWCIFSQENGNQFSNAVKAIAEKPDTRQATMIYTRPTMHVEATWNGRYDFICTNTVQLLVRQERLIYIVNMRSSDAVLGYKGDYAWHKWVRDQVVETLRNVYGMSRVQPGEIIWNANSFHIYPRHRHLVEKWVDELWESGAL